MKPQRILRDDVKKLSPSDRTVLCQIYFHRCLTENLLYEFFYRHENPKRTYAEWHVKKLIKDKYIKAIDYGEMETALFLAPRGIHMVRRLFKLDSTKLEGVPNEAYNFSAADLSMSSFLIPHQMALNQLVLHLKAMARDLGLPYVYWDEKFSPVKNAFSMRARPDAVMEFENVCFFIEMDRNREAKSVLEKKWAGYRFLFDSDEIREIGTKPVVVLFALDNVVKVERRHKTVLNSIMNGFLDCVRPDFDIYIDTPQNITGGLFERLLRETTGSTLEQGANLLQSRFGFGVGSPDFIKTCDVPPFGLYCRSDQHMFLVDSYDHGPVSVLKKIYSAKAHATLISAKLNLIIPQLVICSDEKILLRHLKAFQCFGIPNVYFTSIQRLKAKSFPEAIFQVSQLGNQYHFMDEALTQPVHEKYFK